MNLNMTSRGFIYYLLRFLMLPFIRRIKPVSLDLVAQKKLLQTGQILYIGHAVSFADHLILNDMLERNGLPPTQFTHGINPFLIMPLGKALKVWMGRLFKSHEAIARVELNAMLAHVREGRNGHIFLKQVPGLFISRPYYYKGFFGELANLAGEKEIQLIPISIFLTRRRKNTERSLYDIFFGTYDVPGRYRKTVQVLTASPKSVLIFSKPIDFRQELTRDNEPERSRDKIEKRLRWILLFHLNNEDLAYRGPTKRSRERKVRRILKEKRLRADLEKVAARQNRSFDSVLKEANKNLREIASDTSERVINLLRIGFDFFWARALEGFDYKPEDLQRIRELNKQGPVVLIPCHRSHADYCAVSYLFEVEGLNIPRFAAGDNLSKWPMGTVLRRAGAFFVRRSFKGETVFPLVFMAYVRYLLRDKHILAFFAEGGRSRTGKLLHPKVGLLSMILDTWLQGIVDDVPIVPMTIDYGKIFEGQAYLNEKDGKEKQRESIGALLQTRKFLFRKHGVVRLRFGRPIYLSEYLMSEGLDKEKLTMRKKLRLLNALGENVMNHINRMVTLTAANIVAGILMATPRRGMTMSQLRAFSVIAYRYLKRRKIEVTFSEKSFDSALKHAIDNFVQWETIVKVDVGGETVINIPETKRGEMEYYKNNGLHFMLDLALFSFGFSWLAQNKPTLADIQAFAEEVFELLSIEFIMDREYPTDRTIDYAFKSLQSLGGVEMEDDRLTYGGDQFGRESVALSANFIINFFESYFVTAEILTRLETDTIPKKDFLKQCLAKGRLMYAVGAIARAESLNKVSFDNALNKYVSLGFVKIKAQNNFKNPSVEILRDKMDDFLALREKLQGWMNHTVRYMDEPDRTP